MHKIRKGDEVIVIRGKSKGVRGKVLRVVKDDHTKVVVEGANLVKKAIKPNPNTNTRGGIMEREAALPVCNVAIYNPVAKKGDKVGFKKLENGRKVRYFKSNNELVDLE